VSIAESKDLHAGAKTKQDFAGNNSLSRSGGAAPARPDWAMKSRKAVRAIAGILLCGAGLWLALRSPYRERNYLIDAGGCQLETTIVEQPGGISRGSVVLFHGISANRKIMSYLARGFAQQGLRVYVPDFPGHGRTPGPFSSARAEQCGEALLRELLARGVISADRTIVAGHSMGGAVALRIVSRVPVAGVIAISPAPMRAAHGVSQEMLLFHGPPPLPPHSLIMSGLLEPETMRGNAADLLASGSNDTAKFMVIPGASHVGILFSAATVSASREWTSQVLHIPATSEFPSHGPLVGALMGFAGLLLIAVPFLQEVTGKKLQEKITPTGVATPIRRLLLEFAAGSILVVAILRFWIPLKMSRVFQGDYLASFLLLLGVAFLAVHWKAARLGLSGALGPWMAAAFAGLALFLLITAWFDLTFYEAWLPPAKWARFPLLFVALVPYHFAEEIVLGPVREGEKWRRLVIALSLRLVSWVALIVGVWVLHSGEILMGLLAFYFAVFNLIQRRGMDIVHYATGSAAAAAIFGAILQAGFCLVIFPIT
jgi:pimeloyl-ACP methyl ester carboxylesterase